jgi:hypothetical protein
MSGPQARSTDSLSVTSKQESLSPAAHHPARAPLASRHVLPADLPNAIKHLNDQELDDLLSAALAEQNRRRGTKLPKSDDVQREGKVETASPALTRGRINAVRAAFKAGITPTRIARQFGLSKSDVRLASDSPKR